MIQRNFALAIAGLSLTLASSACWHSYSGSREPGCRGGIEYLESTYRGAPASARLIPGEASGDADCGEEFPYGGFAPCEDGRHPVVIYVPGTVQPYDHGFIFQLLERLAQQGFLAVSLAYANRLPGQDCARYRARGRCMFDSERTDSAIAKICALPQADCGRGIAVLGHSQGGLIASLAADYYPEVRWVHALGITGNPPSSVSDLDCVLPKQRKLPSERLLVACGDCDVFFDGTRLNSCSARSPGVTEGLMRISGLQCGSRQACLRRGPAGGARHGWIKIPGKLLRDGEADHCYMFQHGCMGPTDTVWLTDPSLPWALPALLDDLRRALKLAPR